MSVAAIQVDSRRDTFIVAALTLPFLLNDFANIYVQDYRYWLAIDYVFVKAIPLAIIVYLLRSGRITVHDLGLRSVGFARFAAWSYFLTLIGVVVDQEGSRAFALLLPDTRLGKIPNIPKPLLARVDLYVGLALVAMVEEMIFRGLYFTVLARYFASKFAVFAISAVAFGLIHWSLGCAAMAHTAIIGAVFMVCVWRTGSILPSVVAHFLLNYVAFSGLLPL